MVENVNSFSLHVFPQNLKHPRMRMVEELIRAMTYSGDLTQQGNNNHVHFLLLGKGVSSDEIGSNIKDATGSYFIISETAPSLGELILWMKHLGTRLDKISVLPVERIKFRELAHELLNPNKSPGHSFWQRQAQNLPEKDKVLSRSKQDGCRIEQFLPAESIQGLLLFRSFAERTNDAESYPQNDEQKENELDHCELTEQEWEDLVNGLPIPYALEWIKAWEPHAATLEKLEISNGITIRLIQKFLESPELTKSIINEILYPAIHFSSKPKVLMIASMVAERISKKFEPCFQSDLDRTISILTNLRLHDWVDKISEIYRHAQPSILIQTASNLFCVGSREKARIVISTLPEGFKNDGNAIFWNGWLAYHQADLETATKAYQQLDLSPVNSQGSMHKLAVALLMRTVNNEEETYRCLDSILQNAPPLWKNIARFEKALTMLHFSGIEEFQSYLDEQLSATETDLLKLLQFSKSGKDPQETFLNLLRTASGIYKTWTPPAFPYHIWALCLGFLWQKSFIKVDPALDSTAIGFDFSKALNCSAFLGQPHTNIDSKTDNFAEAIAERWYPQFTDSSFEKNIFRKLEQSIRNRLEQ